MIGRTGCPWIKSINIGSSSSDPTSSHVIGAIGVVTLSVSMEMELSVGAAVGVVVVVQGFAKVGVVVSSDVVLDVDISCESDGDLTSESEDGGTGDEWEMKRGRKRNCMSGLGACCCFKVCLRNFSMKNE